MRKKETFYRKFKYKVVELAVTVNGRQVKSYYMVARKSIIFGIPFWWTTSWCSNDFDAVNMNREKHDEIDKAKRQMRRGKTPVLSN